MISLSLLLAAFVQAASGQTMIASDAWISSRAAVGVSSATARLEIQASSSALEVFQISGAGETPFWVVNTTGSVGVGVSPAARLDVNGSGDSSAVGLMLRDGGMYPSSGSYQMTFGYNGTTNMRHAIATYHSTSAVNGSIDFYIWNTALSQSSVGNLDVMSLVVLSSAGTNIGSMRVRPVASSTFSVQLEVSDGSAPGGGTIERASEQAPSSRERKMDIVYLGEAEELQAYHDIEALKPAQFRYKSFDRKKKILIRDTHQPLRRGLIFEDAPNNIKGPGESIVIDQRVNNLEMAARELLQKLDAVQEAADKIGGKR